MNRPQVQRMYSTTDQCQTYCFFTDLVRAHRLRFVCVNGS